MGKKHYLIRKGGYWYRPNSQGYTSCTAEAGRYSLDDATRLTHPNGPNAGHRRKFVGAPDLGVLQA